MGDDMDIIIKKVDVNNTEAINFLIGESLKLFIEVSPRARRVMEKDNDGSLKRLFYNEFRDTLKKDNIIYCAYIDNELVGIINMESNNYLADLYVKKEYRNNKIGSRLLKNLIENCGDFDVIKVDARVEAISLYERFSFQKTGKLSGRSIPMELERKNYGK